MPCPICDGETDPKIKPFCSKRCADADLGKWLTGDYAIAVCEDDESELEDQEFTQSEQEGSRFLH